MKFVCFVEFIWRIQTSQEPALFFISLVKFIVLTHENSIWYRWIKFVVWIQLRVMTLSPESVALGSESWLWAQSLWLWAQSHDSGLRVMTPGSESWLQAQSHDWYLIILYSCYFRVYFTGYIFFSVNYQLNPIKYYEIFENPDPFIKNIIFMRQTVIGWPEIYAFFLTE